MFYGSPELHRKILLCMAEELEIRPIPWLDSRAALIRKYALQWAIDQTQQPAPPPGGWPKEFRSPESAVRFIEEALDHGTMMQKPVAMISALEWALPILRRAACVVLAPTACGTSPGQRSRNTPAATRETHEDPVMTIEVLLAELNCIDPGEPIIDPKIIYTSPTGRRLYITRHHLQGGIDNWPLPGKYEVQLGDRTIYGEHIEIAELLGKEPAPAKRKR